MALVYGTHSAYCVSQWQYCRRTTWLLQVKVGGAWGPEGGAELEGSANRHAHSRATHTAAKGLRYRCSRGGQGTATLAPHQADATATSESRSLVPTRITIRAFAQARRLPAERFSGSTGPPPVILRPSVLLWRTKTTRTRRQGNRRAPFRTTLHILPCMVGAPRRDEARSPSRPLRRAAPASLFLYEWCGLDCPIACH